MMHPNTETRHARDATGVGVFATEDIQKGTIIWVLDRFDRVLDPGAVRMWPSQIQRVVERFGYIDPDGAVVVCWDHARLMNHSCDPTSIGIGRAFEVARRSVRRGEEITCDYGLLNMTGTLDCACGAPACRRRISALDAEPLFDMWGTWARDAFEAARCVAQPLLPFARADGADAAIVQALRSGGTADLPSARTLLRPPTADPLGTADRLWVLS